MSRVLLHPDRKIKISTRPTLSDLHALQFDSSALSYAGTAAALALGTELSVECHVKPTAIGGNFFIGGFGTSGSADRFYLTQTNTNKFQVFLRSTATATLYGVTGTTTIVPGNVYHIAATYSNTTNILRLFVNGIQEGGDNIVSVGSVGVRQLFIGGVNNGTFTGVIDNFRFYRRALTIAEVAAHSTGTFADNTSLTIDWRMDAGFGTGISDLSGNGNHGIMQSAVQHVARLVDF